MNKTILNKLQEQWSEINTPLGKQLGYPDCCIKEFCEQPPELLNRTKPTKDDKRRYKASFINSEFTGFIPCKEHAKQIVQDKISLAGLIKNRDQTIAEFPFA